MALTEQRLRTEAAAAPRSVQRVTRRAALTLMTAWVVLFPLSMILEPTAASNAPEPWWAYVAAYGLFASMIAAFVGLGRRMRYGVGASLVASSIFATGVFACPATGHHAFGLWWIGEFAASLALVALSGREFLRVSQFARVPR